jgi:predicted CXXCH cytochrome family protein
MASFTPYDSNTLDASDIGQPEDSKLCLSCHDGTVAIDSWGGNSGSSTIGGSGLIDTLSDMHPIGFTYSTDLATTDGDLYDPASTPSGLGGTIAQDMLNGGNMGCASCHDVHDTTGIPRLLRKDYSGGSDLCKTCHKRNRAASEAA